MRRFVGMVLLGMGVVAGGLAAHAQGELAATLEVLNAGVTVQRVNTDSFLPVVKEGIVGVGDIIRTDETGRARITFFADGTETDLQPSTEYTISEFTSDGTSFQLTVEVLVGLTTQRLGRILDANSSYNVNTQGMTLAARGTAFQIRVEESGRAAMIVNEGNVAAVQGEETELVPPEFGIRAEQGEGLSDVVPATSFDQLDAALDGCAVTIRTTDDVSLNVRLSPSSDAPRVGVIAASDITLAYGSSEGGWYRIAFDDGFGWVLSSTGSINRECAGLRVFPASHIEDASLYSNLSEDIDLDSLPTPEATPDAEATPDS